jgi:hypothetical protein
LVFVVTVQNLNIDACLGHAACEFTELTGFILPQALDEDFALVNYPDTGRFQGAAGCRSVVKQKMGQTFAIDGESAAALDADACASQSVAHVGEGSGTVF